MALGEDDDAPGEEPQEAVEVLQPSRGKRSSRDGSRPKVHARGALKRLVFRESLVARADEKAAAPFRAERPQVRGDCEGGQRPCPWVGCKYHLYLSVNPETGAITISFPDKEVWELEATCALDVAQSGGETLERVGELTNLTRERIRQVEVRALLRLKQSSSDQLR